MYNFVRSFGASPLKEFDGKKVLRNYVVYKGEEFLRKVIHTEDHEIYEFGRIENDNRTFTYVFRNKRKATDKEIEMTEEEQKEKEKLKREGEIMRAFGRQMMCGEGK